MIIKVQHITIEGQYGGNYSGRSPLFPGAKLGFDACDFPEADLDDEAALYLRPEDVADHAVLGRAVGVPRLPEEAGAADEVGLQPAGGRGEVREAGEVAAQGADELRKSI